MALWDALARAMDVPLAVLLGGEIRPLPAYDSFEMLDRRTEALARGVPARPRSCRPRRVSRPQLRADNGFALAF
jgi:hypothetical protein